MSNEKLRFRLYLDGEIVIEEWIAVNDQEAIELAPGRHASEAAKHPEKEWMIEVFDPDAPEDEAYARFGSDKEGMVMPLQIDLQDFRD